VPIPVAARSRSEADRLLGFWVRIPPGAWISVSCECCVLSGRVSVTGRSLVQRSPTDCGVSEWDHEASIMMRSWPTRGCRATGERTEVSIPKASQQSVSHPTIKLRMGRYAASTGKQRNCGRAQCFATHSQAVL
jgi:hypothetical protein